MWIFLSFSPSRVPGTLGTLLSTSAKLLELTFLQKVINLLNNYQEDQFLPRRKIFS